MYIIYNLYKLLETVNYDLIRVIGVSATQKFCMNSELSGVDLHNISWYSASSYYAIGLIWKSMLHVNQMSKALIYTTRYVFRINKFKSIYVRTTVTYWF